MYALLAFYAMNSYKIPRFNEDASMSRNLAHCNLFPAPALVAAGVRFSAKIKTTKTTTRC